MNDRSTWVLRAKYTKRNNIKYLDLRYLCALLRSYSAVARLWKLRTTNRQGSVLIEYNSMKYLT
jgi:hypothetical protein